MKATTVHGVFERKTERDYKWVVVYNYVSPYTGKKIKASWHTTKKHAEREASKCDSLGIYPVDDELNGWIPVSEKKAKEIEEKEKGIAFGKMFTA